MAGPDPVTFGRRLKAALVLADMTASELAAEVGADLEISRATIERVMQGKRAPRPWEVKRFAEALGVSEEFLLDQAATSSRNGRDLAEDLAAVLREEIRELRDELRDRDQRLEQSLAQLRDQVTRARARE